MKFLFLLGLLAFAAARRPILTLTPEQAFEGLDTNRNETLEYEELLMYMMSFDEDDDGEVTLEEYTNEMNNTAPHVINGTFLYYDLLDDHRDYVLTNKTVSKAFEFLDSGGEDEKVGFITPTEFENKFPEMKKGIRESIKNVLNGQAI